MCLLAGGAVMVYSASLGATAAPGGGDGTVYLVKYLATGRSASWRCTCLRGTALEGVRAHDAAAAGVRSPGSSLAKMPGLGVRSTAPGAGSAPARCSSSRRS